jgi:hypothetical protein
MFLCGETAQNDMKSYSFVGMILFFLVGIPVISGIERPVSDDRAVTSPD